MVPHHGEEGPSQVKHITLLEKKMRSPERLRLTAASFGPVFGVETTSDQLADGTGASREPFGTLAGVTQQRGVNAEGLLGLSALVWGDLPHGARGLKDFWATPSSAGWVTLTEVSPGAPRQTCQAGGWEGARP